MLIISIIVSLEFKTCHRVSLPVSTRVISTFRHGNRGSARFHGCESHRSGAAKRVFNGACRLRPAFRTQGLKSFRTQGLKSSNGVEGFESRGKNEKAIEARIRDIKALTNFGCMACLSLRMWPQVPVVHSPTIHQGTRVTPLTVLDRLIGQGPGRIWAAVSTTGWRCSIEKNRSHLEEVRDNGDSA